MQLPKLLQLACCRGYAVNVTFLLKSSSFGSSVSWMGLEVVGFGISSVQSGVGTLFWVQRFKIIISKRNRKEKQRDPRIVDAQRIVRIIRCRYDRCSWSNDVWFTWSSEFTSFTWGGDVVSDKISSSRIISEGIISTSACNSWRQQSCQARTYSTIVVRRESPVCHPVTPAATEHPEALCNKALPDSISVRDVPAPFFQQRRVTCCCSGKWFTNTEPCLCRVGVM